MNYIRHLSAFYAKATIDDRLNPTHISLYHALFQFWNMNRFENPISVTRTQVVKLSKIGSHHTLYKCLYDLHHWGYIVYLPTHNPLKGSLVNMCIFDTSTAQVEPPTCAESEQVLHNNLCKSETSTAPALHPSINNIEYINNKTERGEKTQAQIPEIENSVFKNNGEIIKPGLTQKAKRKKVAPKKEKVFVAPNLYEALAFFKVEQYPEVEGRKFFYHFEANGWKVGGKTPMKNWNAAAHNWMLNTSRYEPEPKQNAVKLNTRKDYGEPL